MDIMEYAREHYGNYSKQLNSIVMRTVRGVQLLFAETDGGSFYLVICNTQHALALSCADCWKSGTRSDFWLAPWQNGDDTFGSVCHYFDDTTKTLEEGTLTLNNDAEEIKALYKMVDERSK